MQNQYETDLNKVSILLHVMMGLLHPDIRQAWKEITPSHDASLVFKQFKLNVEI